MRFKPRRVRRRGQLVSIDDTTWPVVKQYQWRIIPANYLPDADRARVLGRNGKPVNADIAVAFTSAGTVILHRLVCLASALDAVLCLSGDYLDCRLENLLCIRHADTGAVLAMLQACMLRSVNDGKAQTTYPS